jgi:hypothetical protein
MRIWKTQSHISASRIVGRDVAVRSWDKSTETFTFDIVKVAEVSPCGNEFASFDGAWKGYNIGDIRRVF